MWWSKPKPEEPKQSVLTNELKIYLSDGCKLGWDVTPWDNTRPKTEPYQRFIKWYFGRKDSPEYLLQCNDAATLIRRDSIVHFAITVKST